jgi:hypothetical protein
MMKALNKIHPERPKSHIPLMNEQADLLWELLKSCWAYDSQDRPTATEVRDQVCVCASSGHYRISMILQMKHITPEGLLGTA